MAIYKGREEGKQTVIEQLESERDEANERVAVLWEALKEIAKGEGAFNRDPFVHACNVVEEAKATANAALTSLPAAAKALVENQRTPGFIEVCKVCGAQKRNKQQTCYAEEEGWSYEPENCPLRSQQGKGTQT